MSRKTVVALILAVSAGLGFNHAVVVLGRVIDDPIYVEFDEPRTRVDPATDVTTEEFGVSTALGFFGLAGGFMVGFWGYRMVAFRRWNAGLSREGRVTWICIMVGLAIKTVASIPLERNEMPGVIRGALRLAAYAVAILLALGIREQLIKPVRGKS